jgi:uncharacterized membrane protein
LVHAVAIDAQPGMLTGDASLSAAGVASLVAVAAGCLVSGRLAAEGHSNWRVLLDAVGLAVVAYLTALALDGPMLALAWAVEAVALAHVARAANDEAAAWAALAHLVGGLVVGVAGVVQPDSLVYGLSEPLDAAIALGSVAVAALMVAEKRIGPAGWAPALTGAAAVVLLYLASAAVVTPFQPGNAEFEPVFELGARQQGQMVLSVFWAALGLSALVVGLRRDLRPLRLGALTLLMVTIAKVFLFDLATLTSVYRVVSFLGLGLLLLVGAGVWQRLRPRPLPDLRELMR